MTTLTLDTSQLLERLKAAGVPEEQAEAAVRMIVEEQPALVNRTHPNAGMEAIFAPIRTDLTLLKWLTALLLAGLIMLIIKDFA